MTPVEYDKFVRSTDQYAAKSQGERKAIALYGLVGEIGSLVSAVKKKILAEGGEAAWNHPNEEIKEEIGDVLWYCFSLSQIVNGNYFEILSNDIALLRREIGGQNERAEKISAALADLHPSSKDEFLRAADIFPENQNFTFDDYQQLAFKTARTDGLVLLEVCLAVLPQLGAELLRPTLPEIELTLNKNIADREANVVLGEITWHLAAIASLYHLSLNQIVEFNRTKVSFRSTGRVAHTQLHDENRDKREQFPRQFEVAFVQIGKKHSRMYFEGRRLGNDLTDNAYEDDGYRFHDVLHLAFIAHLGWSPVFRGFMKRKRPDVDEVEDGGRAKVVEELVIKAIHSDGERQAEETGRCALNAPTALFPERSTIPFRLLKTIKLWIEGLEVQKNTSWEWEDAIYDGCKAFFQLRKHRQGTVRIDLEKRTMIFSPMVTPEVLGVIVGLGMGVAEAGDSANTHGLLSDAELAWAQGNGGEGRAVAAKRALLEALGIPASDNPNWSDLEIQIVNGNKLSINASNEIQKRIWKLQSIDYKPAFTSLSGNVICTVAAIADSADLGK